MKQLTAIILTYNEESHIADCIQSLLFAPAVVVFDSYSTDRTVMIAQEQGATVIQNRFENYASQRNAALNAVAEDTRWVFFVDADERVTPQLADEIQQVIQQDDYAGWQVPRDNYIFGRLTRGAGWYPDYQTRLLKIGYAHYDPTRQVHEVVMLDGELGTLQNALVHYNYRDLAHFLTKQRQYSRFDARILYDDGIRPKPQNYILQPLRQFKWRFFTLGGFRDGWHGFKLSVLLGWYEFKKYWHLRQLWRK